MSQVAAGGAVPARRAAIDVARILSLVVVVCGHLFLAVIDNAGGRLRTANLLALRPGIAWVAALSPMPVFFAAGGWANAGAVPRSAAPRLRRLVGAAATVVGVWSLAVIGTIIVHGDAGIVGQGARVATQPLWFLAAYMPLAAGGRKLSRLVSAHVVVAIGTCLVVLGLVDIARFALDAPNWLGWPGFLLAWGTPWLIGAWWRARRVRSPGASERRAGLALIVVAGVGCVLLVRYGGYDPALIDGVRDARSNTNPPTLYTAVVGLAQAGLLMVAAGALDRLGHRWRRLWDRAGDAAVGVYVWHLTALVLCAAIIAAGVPTPRRLTAWWWLSRPIWWAAVLTVTSALVALSAWASGRSPRRPSPPREAPAVLGVIVASIAAAVVGLVGPTSLARATGCALLFLAAWWLLPPATRVPRRAARAGHDRAASVQ